MSNHNSSILFGIVLFLALIALLPFSSDINGSKPDKVIEDKKSKRLAIIDHWFYDKYHNRRAYILKDATTGLEYFSMVDVGIIELKGKSTNE